jgi:hypothetical protein
MFASLNGGYFPICLLVVVAAWFIAGVRPLGGRLVLAVTLPPSDRNGLGFSSSFFDLVCTTQIW